MQACQHRASTTIEACSIKRRLNHRHPEIVQGWSKSSCQISLTNEPPPAS